MEKNKVLREIRREQAMRKRVYKTAFDKTKGSIFINDNEAMQYKDIQLAHEIIEAMTPREFAKLKKRIADKKIQQTAQTEMKL